MDWPDGHLLWRWRLLHNVSEKSTFRQLGKERYNLKAPRQADRQTRRHADMQTHRQTDMHAYMDIETVSQYK